jgi:hypothetical protein
MSPECKEGAHQPKFVCPNCGKKAITKTGQFYQCCSDRGGCGYGTLDESEFVKKQTGLKW